MSDQKTTTFQQKLPVASIFSEQIKLIDTMLVSGNANSLQNALDTLWSNLGSEIRKEMGPLPSVEINKRLADKTNYSYKKVIGLNDRRMYEQYNGLSSGAKKRAKLARESTIIHDYVIKWKVKLIDSLEQRGMHLIEATEKTNSRFPTPTERMPSEEEKPERKKAGPTVD